jgi:hypothetical protein
MVMLILVRRSCRPSEDKSGQTDRLHGTGNMVKQQELRSTLYMGRVRRVSGRIQFDIWRLAVLLKNYANARFVQKFKMWDVLKYCMRLIKMWDSVMFYTWKCLMNHIFFFCRL